ncbi:L1 [Gammapapillomavirus 8]|uniref:Major capsid protein L1 n=1 Tax=Gammapapillomavirus 8 TaxID=1175850 RepID=A0A2D2ALG1_9PAPI|nr:L1 [Gammapapillomavirus 8]
MALWQQQSGKLYLPPAKPVAKVLSTDDYITGTNLFFHAGSQRLLTVGHPYFEIHNDAVPGQVQVPKVSGSQYRVFRLKLPDPNKFALIDKTYYNSEHERLVWRLRGLQIGRGGPLGLGTSGHPLFNKIGDTENPTVYQSDASGDNRQNVSTDPKQIQMFIVGCEPAIGEHWDIAKPCEGEDLNDGDCPPIQLLNTVIQDGDMCDIGFGAANFKTLQQDMSSAPLDIVNQTCKWPDIIKMEQDIYGDKLFFFTRREQAYARHYFARSGTMGDSIPMQKDFYISPDNTKQDLAQNNLGSHIYFPTCSGSLVSSETQLFNRPYWLQKAQGPNNGICWNNQLFVTLVDNSRNTNFTISVYSKGKSIPESYTYKAEDFKQYLRHTEEFDFELIFQLCKVPLVPDVLAHLNVMNSQILDNWQLSFVPPPPQSIEDTYRFITSLATRCPPSEEETENKDPFKQYNFWTVDLTETFSTELSQFSLGRKFLFQTGMLKTPSSLKRVRTTSSSGTTKRAKRRKTKY